MRRRRYLLIGLLCLAALVVGSVWFYFKFIDTRYFRAEFYSDTGISVPSNDPKTDGPIVYEEQEGKVTLVLTRGEPHGVMTTEHDWVESVSIEIPSPSRNARIDLGSPNVRTSLGSYKWRQFPSIGEGGVRGHIEIESADKRQITASYDIVIDGVYPRFVPEHQHREVVFRGRSTFRARPRPEGEHLGIVWPNGRR